MPIDWSYSSGGGLLLDGAGDIASTDDILTSVVDIARTRLVADLEGWKLYRIGADLKSQLGNANTAEIEVQLQRLAHDSLVNSFLPEGSFDVKTLSFGETIEIYVYINQQLVLKVLAEEQAKQITVQLA